MINKHKINFKNTLSSYKSPFGIMLFIIPLLGYIALEPYLYPNSSFQIPYLFLLFPIMVLVPAIILHVRYYVINSDTTLTINTDDQTIKIKQNGEAYHYSYLDIENIVRTNGIGAFNVEQSGYLNRTDFPRRRRVPNFGSFGYFMFRFKDGNEFYFTSLMLNLRTFFHEHQLAGTTVYAFYPYL